VLQDFCGNFFAAKPLSSFLQISVARSSVVAGPATGWGVEGRLCNWLWNFIGRKALQFPRFRRDKPEVFTGHQGRLNTPQKHAKVPRADATGTWGWFSSKGPWGKRGITGDKGPRALTKNISTNLMNTDSFFQRNSEFICCNIIPAPCDCLPISCIVCFGDSQTPLNLVATTP
jgi:hypothetical protein